MCLGVCLCVCFAGVALAEEKSDEALRVDRCPAPTGALADESDAEREERKLQVAVAAYDLGLGLYEEGDYEGSVDAFVESYCNKEHSSSLFNIGQSYERMLQFERAVKYFQRFVLEAEETDPNAKKARLRAEVLGNLPAQLRIATFPAGASITIRNEAGVTARGKANGNKPIEVRQGKYTMRVELPRYIAKEQELVVIPGQSYSEYLTLKPKESTLQVTVAPANARIFINKRLVGTGRYSESLPLGSYEITVEARRRNTATRIVMLTGGKSNSQVIELAEPIASGRLELLIASGAGLGAAGAVAVSSIFDQDPVITAGAAAATAAVGFGGAYYGIPEDITRGQAYFLIESTLIGFAEGYLIGSYVACEEGPEVEGKRNEDCDDGVRQGAAITGGIVAAVAATATRSKLNLSTADAALIGSGGMWGLVSGSLFFAIFDSEFRLRDPMLFVGMNVGLLATTGLVANTDVSLRRIAIINLAGMGGMVGGIGLSRALAGRDDQVQHYALLGLITGLVSGTFLTRALDDDPIGYSDQLSLVPGVSSAQDISGKSVMSFGFSSAF